MKKYIIPLLFLGVLLPITSCSNQDDSVVSAADRTFIQQAYEQNQLDIQNGQVVRTKGTNENLKRFAQLLIQNGSKTSEELLALAQERNIPLSVELSVSVQNQVTSLINLPATEFEEAYLNTIIQSREKVLKMYQQQIGQGKDNALREWASGKISNLVKEKENAEEILYQIGF